MPKPSPSDIADAALRALNEWTGPTQGVSWFNLPDWEKARCEAAKKALLAAVAHPGVPEDILLRIARECRFRPVRKALAAKASSEGLLHTLAQDSDFSVRMAVSANPHSTEAVLWTTLSSEGKSDRAVNATIQALSARFPPLNAQETLSRVKGMAVHADGKAIALGHLMRWMDASVRGELLQMLIPDREPGFRWAAAGWVRSIEDIAALTDDPNENVRHELCIHHRNGHEALLAHLALDTPIARLWPEDPATLGRLAYVLCAWLGDEVPKHLSAWLDAWAAHSCTWHEKQDFLMSVQELVETAKPDGKGFLVVTDGKRTLRILLPCRPGIRGSFSRIAP
ncbi:hypothetical protein WV31_10640 [Magnetospirillum sp. ME-1]|uniref:hypothetical protein n=1 Tax=Magnetospirillum sp. ME-1 TaxID=1639348 RepID=UPI000A17E7B5|nr:hypothetical protein [Magnetospirillum sp. ME-1]ARJ66084.1 hypothetical protein WV31_10640 [Magnetospirillum sp. ME-1]